MLDMTQSIMQSIAEDVGAGDITAQLIVADVMATAQVVVNETAILAGLEWFVEVYRQIDPQVNVVVHCKEGQQVHAGDCVITVEGLAKSIVTGERVALNWLQTLSGTATCVHTYATLLKGTKTRLLDTRKTIPGLRAAQKYAVTVGGGENHRMGLYDAFLIKENHIMSCGSISRAIERARHLHPDKQVEVEVESLDELAQAITAKADIVMLDNFTRQEIAYAVEMTDGRLLLEVSGDVTLDSIKSIAQTGVDYVSVGAITKHVRAIDFSMRVKDVL